jgi:hypothetical protein
MLQAGSFKTVESGETTFFPFGFMGPGYLVDANQESAIRSAISRYFVLSFVVAIVGANLFGIRALLLIVPLLGWYWLWSRRVVAGLPVSPARMTYRGAGRAQVQFLGRRWLAAMFVLSVVMTALSIGMITDPEHRLAGVLGLALFGLATIRWAMLMRETWRS